MEKENTRVEELSPEEEVPDNNSHKPETGTDDHSSHLTPGTGNRTEHVETENRCENQIDANARYDKESEVEVWMRERHWRVQDLDPREEIDTESTEFVTQEERSSYRNSIDGDTENAEEDLGFLHYLSV